MTKAFRVAEHIFHLSIPGETRVWEALRQYEPFEVPVDGAEPVFELEVVKGEADAPGEVVFADKPEPGMARIDINRSADGRGWHIRMAPVPEAPVCCDLVCSDDFRKACAYVREQVVFSINNSLMLLFAFNTATLGTLEMHSSVVSFDGRGYMFLGKSGTGKSTHSSLWLKHIEGTELMNDDNPIIRVWEDGRVMVYGSPWSGKTPCYRNVQAPVGAIVRIRQAKENVIRRMSIPEAYASVYSSCSGFKADRRMADGLHDTLEKIALGVPCYVLDCLPDEEAARICNAEVAGK